MQRTEGIQFSVSTTHRNHRHKPFLELMRIVQNHQQRLRVASNPFQPARPQLKVMGYGVEYLALTHLVFLAPCIVSCSHHFVNFTQFTRGLEVSSQKGGGRERTPKRIYLTITPSLQTNATLTCVRLAVLIVFCDKHRRAVTEEHTTSPIFCM